MEQTLEGRRSPVIGLLSDELFKMLKIRSFAHALTPDAWFFLTNTILINMSNKLTQRQQEILDYLK